VTQTAFSAFTLPAGEAERAAVCALAGLSGVGGQALEALRRRFGSLAAAAAQGGRALAKVEGLRTDAAQSLEAAGDLEARGRWLLGKAQEIGARVVLPGEDGYPRRLAEASSHPPVLYVLGTFREEARRVAVVGSRRADP
jgi:predicted Rossmann fold nucleotide-binding protein DprA/Smf involved in DNA uptake